MLTVYCSSLLITDETIVIIQRTAAVARGSFGPHTTHNSRIKAILSTITPLPRIILLSILPSVSFTLTLWQPRGHLPTRQRRVQ